MDANPDQFENAACPPNRQEVESDSDIDGNDTDLKADMTDRRDDLKTWAIQYQIKHAALKSLLTVLMSHIADNVLPKDARTLVGTYVTAIFRRIQVFEENTGITAYGLAFLQFDS